MIKTLLLAGTVSILTVAGAQAADVLPEPVPEAYDWSGFYIGIAGGYAWGEFEADSGPSTHPLDDFNDEIDDAKGWLLGGTLGYNFQSENIVFGVEADAFWSDLDEDIVTADPEFHLDLDWLATVRARVGFAFDRFLPYVTGGLAIGGIELESFDNVAPPAGDDDSNTHLGWTVGAGAEFAVTDNISIKGEYNFVDLGSEDYDLTGGVFFGEEELDFEAHIVKFGVNFRL